MAAHGFVDVHCGKGGNVKAGEPHVEDDGYFQVVLVVFEFFAISSRSDLVSIICRYSSGSLFADVITTPIFLPIGAEFEEFAVDFHGDVA